MKLFVHYFINS